MKIKLLQDHLIGGKIKPADSVVDIHAGVAEDLITRGIAIVVSSKPTKKKAK